MERGELPEIKSIDISSVTQQCLSQLAMAVGAGVMEWHQPTVGTLIM